MRLCELLVWLPHRARLCSGPGHTKGRGLVLCAVRSLKGFRLRGHMISILKGTLSPHMSDRLKR